MAEPVVISDFGQVREHKGGFGPKEAEVRFGELAVDVIGHATSAELFQALRGHLGDYEAEQVSMLLEANGMTFDGVIEAEERAGDSA